MLEVGEVLSGRCVIDGPGSGEEVAALRSDGETHRYGKSAFGSSPEMVSNRGTRGV
jgi:hypothetical protein